MDKNQCAFCLKNDTTINCQLCSETSCKHCSHFLMEDSFELLPEVPEELTHDTYCPNCFMNHVEAPLNDYNHYKDLAENVEVYMSHQAKMTRLFPRTEKAIIVENCKDKETALLQLAFLTAKKDYPAIMNVELTTKKESISGSYKKQVWDGKGVPVNPQRKRK